MTLLATDKLCFSFQGQSVLHDVDFVLKPGERVGLVGDNGTGKTTFLRCLLGLAAPESGRVLLDERPVKGEKGDHGFTALRRKVGFLFQHPDDQLFSPTVLEDVAFGPLNLGQDPKQATATADQALERVGCSHLRERSPHELSGGEKKLVALAGVLAMEPHVLLLDEPETGLDRAAKTRLMDILNGLEASLLIVSHDMDFLGSVTTRLCCLENGHLDCDPRLHAHTHTHIHVHGHQPHKHE